MKSLFNPLLLQMRKVEENEVIPCRGVVHPWAVMQWPGGWASLFPLLLGCFNSHSRGQHELEWPSCALLGICICAFKGSGGSVYLLQSLDLSGPH